MRRAEAQRSQTIKAIQVAKTPEEEATLRDRLGETNLGLDRLNARVTDIQAKAQAASITLPTAPPDEPRRPPRRPTRTCSRSTCSSRAIGAWPISTSSG